MNTVIPSGSFFTRHLSAFICLGLRWQLALGMLSIISVLGEKIVTAQSRSTHQESLRAFVSSCLTLLHEPTKEGTTIGWSFLRILLSSSAIRH
jgi:hypothetical protein